MKAFSYKMVKRKKNKWKISGTKINRKKRRRKGEEEEEKHGEDWEAKEEERGKGEGRSLDES